MIISTTSWGSLPGGPPGAVGDGCAVGVFGEAPPEHIPRILDKVEYQVRLMSNPTAAVAIVVERRGDKAAAWVPGNEDVGVFAGCIVLQEVEFR